MFKFIQLKNGYEVGSASFKEVKDAYEFQITHPQWCVDDPTNALRAFKKRADVLRSECRKLTAQHIHLWPEAPQPVLDFIRTGSEKYREAARTAASNAGWSDTLRNKRGHPGHKVMNMITHAAAPVPALMEWEGAFCFKCGE